MSLALPNIFLGLVLLVFLFKKNKILGQNGYTKLAFIFVSYFFIKATYFNSFTENFSIYKHLFVFLVFSFLIFNIKNLLLSLKGYVLGVFLAVVISFINILIFYFSFKTLPFGNSSEVQNLIIIHRPYFGFMCLISIILIDFLTPKIKNKKEKIVYVLIAFFTIIFLFIIVARLSLFLLIFYITVRIFFYFKFSRIKSIIILTLILASLTSFFMLNKNLKERLHIKNSYEKTIAVLKNQEPRFVIWDCFVKQISNSEFNIFFGYKNRKSIQENLNKCYNNSIDNVSKRNYYLATQFNTHNQFFDVFLGGGVIGFILIFTIFIFSAYIFRGDFNLLFIIVSFFLFFTVENLLNRQLGAYLFGIFTPLFFKIFESKNEI